MSTAISQTLSAPVELAVFEQGNPAGPTLVLVHGWPDTHLLWEHVAGLLSDRIGGRPSRNPVTPGDVVATIYNCLGIDPHMEIVDRLARPFTLVPRGEVVRELLA